MQKKFTIFLLAIAMYISICGYGSAFASSDITISEEADDTYVSAQICSQTEKEDIYYTEDDIVMIAKLLWCECRGVPSDTEKACVAWTVLNRVDKYEQTISEVVTAPNQFAYSKYNPVVDELYTLAKDVLTRWNDEKNGKSDIGRVLPNDYLWYGGDGKHNYFRNIYTGKFSIWNYSLASPYES